MSEKRAKDDEVDSSAPAPFKKLKTTENNDGSSMYDPEVVRFLVYGLALYVVVSYIIYFKHIAGIFVPDRDVDPVTGRERIRHISKHTKQKVTPRDAALEGHFTLIDIEIEDDGLVARIPGKRYNATGTFCKIEWSKQQQNPSTVPKFKDLVSQSYMCEGTHVEVDLFDLAQDARAYDATFKNPTAYTGKKPVNLPVEPAGVVFHETRCGSTLTANLLAAFSPDHSRVYSESPPPVHALRACDRVPCDPDKHHQLIKDVFYLMGRTLRVDRPQHVFYKIQSIGTMDIDKFTSVFPDTPWVFLYRDSVEVMMSHFKDSQTLKNKGKKRLPVCARGYVKPMNRQPRSTQKILQKHDKTMDNIEVADYCAAHLAALSLSAMEEHKRTGMGRFINYNQLPEIAWERILPEFFGINPITDGMVENMKEVSGVYSKGRAHKANQVWQEDATKKHNRATPEVIAAAHEFLSDIYDQMENLSKS